MTEVPARILTLFEDLADDPEAQAVVARSRLKLLLELSDEGASIAVDGRVRPFRVGGSADGFRPDVTLMMSAQTADRFFRGDLDIVKALGAKQIRSRGPMLKILALKPLLDLARSRYQAIG